MVLLIANDQTSQMFQAFIQAICIYVKKFSYVTLRQGFLDYQQKTENRLDQIAPEPPLPLKAVRRQREQVLGILGQLLDEFLWWLLVMFSQFLDAARSSQNPVD